MSNTRLKSSLYKMFLFIPAQNDKVMFFERIQLIGFYVISILALAASAFNLPMDIADGSISTIISTIIFMILILSGLVLFWITRNLRISQWIMGTAILILMTSMIFTAGGRYGLGVLYFMIGFSILYLVVDNISGVILPVYYTAGMTIRLLLGDFGADSIFADPVVASRFMVVLILSGLFGIIASVSMHSILRYISRLAFKDNITGLPNRNKLQEILKSRTNNAKQGEESFSLIAIRLLNFSRLNGYIGTNNGDRILQTITSRLHQQLHGFIGRWSGSIFMTLVNNDNVTELKKVCKSIMSSLSETYHIGDDLVTAHFVIAVSRYPHDASHSSQLLSNVISLLDHTRRQSGDIVFYDEDTLKKEQYRFLLKEAMNQADMDQEFYLVYQPKIRLSDESCVGAEVLLRWKSNDLGPVPPDAFIPIAEETGFIKKITRWVINKAFLDIHQICVTSKINKNKFSFAINLSVADLNDPEFLIFLEQQESTSPTNCIEFELTERMQIDQDPQIQSCLLKLTDLGYRIAIDDFGTGYSSLSYLHQMNAHNLKIDKSFISKIEKKQSKKSSYPIVDAVISMGSSMGMEVTAEGVETKEQVQYLTNQGCDTVQGWYYAKALPLQEFIAYIK